MHALVADPSRELSPASGTRRDAHLTRVFLLGQCGRTGARTKVRRRRELKGWCQGLDSNQCRVTPPDLQSGAFDHSATLAPGRRPRVYPAAGGCPPIGADGGISRPRGRRPAYSRLVSARGGDHRDTSKVGVLLGALALGGVVMLCLEVDRLGDLVRSERMLQDSRRQRVAAPLAAKACCPSCTRRRFRAVTRRRKSRSGA